MKWMLCSCVKLSPGIVYFWVCQLSHPSHPHPQRWGRSWPNQDVTCIHHICNLFSVPSALYTRQDEPYLAVQHPQQGSWVPWEAPVQSEGRESQCAEPWATRDEGETVEYILKDVGRVIAEYPTWCSRCKQRDSGGARASGRNLIYEDVGSEDVFTGPGLEQLVRWCWVFPAMMSHLHSVHTLLRTFILFCLMV